MNKFLEYEKLVEEQWLEHTQNNKNCSACQNWQITNPLSNNPKFQKLVKTYQILEKYQKEIASYQARIKHLLNIKNSCPFYYRYENFTLLWNTCNREEDKRTELIKEIEKNNRKYVSNK